MAIDKVDTPLPPQNLAPIQVVVPDWLDLPAHSEREILNHPTFRGQAIDVEAVGARPEPEVEVDVTATVQTDRGSVTESATFNSATLSGLDDPVRTGPLATERLKVLLKNRSATDYTQASGSPYQTFLNWTVRDLTVVEKLRRDIPLSDKENKLRQRYNLAQREQVGLPPSLSPVHTPTLEDKTVISDEAEVTTVNINDTGESNAVTVLNNRVRGDEVLYVTGLRVNGQQFSYGDNLTVRFTRAGTEDFYEVETFGLPGSPYQADLFLPFLDNLGVSVYASNTLTDVDVTIEYARVERTLVEKALYGLESQVNAADRWADDRMALYDEIRNRIRAGVPVEEEELAKRIDTGTNSTGRR